MSVASIARAAPLDQRGHAIDLRPIAPILERVVQRWNPLQIWLFGSRARGDAGVDSDRDLLAVVPDCPEPADFDDPRTVRRVKRQPDVPSDLIVCRASDFEADRAVPSTLAYATQLDGVLVHEGSDGACREAELSLRHATSPRRGVAHQAMGSACGVQGSVPARAEAARCRGALRVVDSLRAHVRLFNPTWPTREDREADLEAHIRVSAALARTAPPEAGRHIRATQTPQRPAGLGRRPRRIRKDR